MVLGTGPPFDEVTSYHDHPTTGGLTRDSAPVPVRVRIPCDFPLLALPIIAGDGSPVIHQIPAQPFEFVPMCSRWSGHPTAQLIYRIHDVRSVCRQVVRSCRDIPIYNVLSRARDRQPK